MPKFDQLRAGDGLWDCHTEPMGNTTMRRMGCWEVRIISLDPKTRTAVVSWNGNPPTHYTEHSLLRLSWIPKAVRGKCCRCGKPRVPLAKRYRVSGEMPYCECTPMPRKYVDPKARKSERI